MLVPAIRVGLGVHFFRKHNHISLPANHVLWGTYLSGYCLSLVSITSYLVFFFTVYEVKRNLVFILLVYNIYLSASTLYWVPVYTSLNKLGEEKDKLISDLILIVLIFVLLVLIDQIESEVIGILTWFLPVLLPNFIGEIYKISNDYQNNHNISPSKKMEKHIYWLTMLSFNTLVIFNVISAFSITDRGEHKFKQFLITIFSELLKSNAPPTFPLSLFSSLIIVLFSVFLAWWVSKCVIKLLKHVYLDPSKNYFDKL
ncbi:hypothetical protein [Streptococcus pluranimalium]|uniref:hypothetical protein n=1 Tax=Streptococcus pluranimalium TaxID=82348 RepID=UPI0039EBDAFD